MSDGPGPSDPSPDRPADPLPNRPPGGPAARSASRSLARIALFALIGAGLALLARPPAGAPPLTGPLGAVAGFLRALFGTRYPPPVLAAIGLWLAFSLYWQWAARNASAPERKESRGSRLSHVLLISAGQLLVILPVPGLRARLMPAAWPLTALGLALGVAALGLAVWARRALGRQWSAEVTVKVGHELVTGGPYARVRHPIYAAMLLLCVGTTLVWGELHGLVGTVLVLIAFGRKIGLEERAMAGTFGPAWEAYRARTRLLIPGLW